MICFHDPDKEYGFLSNWDMSDFIEDGRTYTSVEQYLMYGKAASIRDCPAVNARNTTSTPKRGNNTKSNSQR